MKQTRNWQCQFRVILLHPLFKPQEAISARHIIGIILSLLRMIFAEELHNTAGSFLVLILIMKCY